MAWLHMHGAAGSIHLDLSHPCWHSVCSRVSREFQLTAALLLLLFRRGVANKQRGPPYTPGWCVASELLLSNSSCRALFMSMMSVCMMCLPGVLA